MHDAIPCSNLLYNRLHEALQSGSEVRVRLSNSSFYGVPINLDTQFIEIMSLQVDKSEKDSSYDKAVWLVKLSEIVAFSYPLESWSKNRLEGLLQAASDRDDPSSLTELD
jgi:hypothetical protein